MSNDWNIQDDEIRVVGSDVQSEGRKSGKPRRVWAWVIAILIVAIAMTLILLICKRSTEHVATGVVEPQVPLGMKSIQVDSVATISSYTEVIHQMVNDIPLAIYIPHNAVPELCLGVPDIKDATIVLAAQAADIRQDNNKIVGAFVLKGEPIAWGQSKKGYCGIIDGKVTIGEGKDTPLFEEATEKAGYFFRQYPLVDNGVIVENNPKGKSIRKALCSRAGEVFIVQTESNESFHDFAQALVDIGVGNAIYLVGSARAYGFSRDVNGNVVEFSVADEGKYEFENYIVWQKFNREKQ